MDSNCKNSWKIISKNYSNCPVHNKVFLNKDNCPSYMIDDTIPPMISHGKEKLFRVGVGFEQGIEQGVGSVTRVGDVHSHAFRFVVLLPDGLKDWDIRDKTLVAKGFRATRKAGIGRIFMSDCFGFKCWFADKSITIYFPSWKRYFVDEARFGYNFALADLKDLLLKFEDVFDIRFSFDGVYHFKCSGQHHGLIHNSLAKMYNRNKEKLNVYDHDGELWLLIDNSNPEGFGLNETEAVSKDKAPQDMDGVVAKFFNNMRDLGLPEAMIELQRHNDESIMRIAQIQEKSVLEASNVRSDVDKRLAWMDANFASHQRVLEKMESSLDRMSHVPSSSGIPSSSLDVRRARINKLLEDFGWR